MAAPNFYLREDGGRFDATLLIGSDGALIGRQKMVHIAQARQFYEQDCYTPSDDGFQVFDTPPRPDRRGGLLRPSLPGEHPQHGWRYYGVLGGGGVHHAASPAVYRPAGGAARSVQSLAAKKYVGEHYMDGGPSLDGVAAQLGISPSYLSRIFSEIDGKRFTQYLSGLRIEKAKQLPKKQPARSNGLCRPLCSLRLQIAVNCDKVSL